MKPFVISFFIVLALTCFVYGQQGMPPSAMPVGVADKFGEGGSRLKIDDFAYGDFLIVDGYKQYRYQTRVENDKKIPRADFGTFNNF